MKKDHGRKETPERNFMDCWTTEHTHRVETHQHNLCSLISCQLESGNNHHCSSVVDRVNESLTWQKKVTRDLIGQQCEITCRLKWDQEKKKKFEKTQIAFVIPAHRNDAVNRQFSSVKRWHGGKEIALGTHVQVWMFPGKSMGQGDTGSAWTRLMGMGWWWLVAGVVKTCSDGALDVRNMSKSWKLRFRQDVWVTCRVNRFWHVTDIG